MKHHHVEQSETHTATVQAPAVTENDTGSPIYPAMIGGGLVLAVAGYYTLKFVGRYKQWKLYQWLLYRPKKPAFIDTTNWGKRIQVWPTVPTKRGIHGNARASRLPEIAQAGYFPSFGIPIGRAIEYPATEWTKTGRGPWIRFPKEGNLLTVSPPGGGKARDSLIPALLYPYTEIGNWFVVDPKGQLAAVTWKTRNAGKFRAVALNPFGLHRNILGEPIGYNALPDPTSPFFIVDCSTLAKAIIVQDGGDSHFPQSAEQVLTGFIIFFAQYPEDEADRNLAAVRAAIASPPDVFRAFLSRMEATGNRDIIERISRLIGYTNEDREALGVIGTLKVQTEFLSIPQIAESLRGKGRFKFSDLRNQPGLSVFVILPGEYLDTCSKWFRVLVASAIRELLANREGQVVTMLLDEFAQLGHLSALENVIALARGYGLRLWPVVQDLTQLRRHYPNSWETILSSSALMQFFGVRDMFTAEWISRRQGNYTAKSTSTSFSNGPSGGSFGHSSGETQAPHLTPQDIIGTDERKQIIFASGLTNAIIAERMPYWIIGSLEGTYNPDPYHVSMKKPGSPPAKKLPRPALKLLPFLGKSS